MDFIEEEDLALRKMPQHEWVSCQFGCYLENYYVKNIH